MAERSPSRTRPPSRSPAGTPLASPRALAGPIVVAGEAGSPLEGALRIAQLLARRDGIAVHVVTVVRPLALPAAVVASIDSDAWQEGRRQRQLAVVRQQMHQTVGVSANFTVGAETGSPAYVAARLAHEHGAALIIVGVDAHGAPGRAATEDAALQITRTAHVPVLAVPPDCALLPRRALVAIDFSEASVRAARAARLVLTAGGSLVLAHVAPDVELRELGKEGWAEIYARGVAALFEELTEELRAPGDVDVETETLHGDPAAALLALAARDAFELIAVGSQATPWVEWHLTGSVSTSVFRGARAPVLIAPPPRADR